MPLDNPRGEELSSDKPTNPLEELYRDLFEDALRGIKHLGANAQENARTFFNKILPDILSGKRDWMDIFEKIDSPDLKKAEEKA